MSTVPQVSDSAAPARRRGVRAWIPLTILILATGAIAWIQRSEDTEEILRFIRSTVIVSVAILLLLAWFLLLSRLRWQVRIGGLVAVILCGVTLGSLVRIDGTNSGAGRLRYAWRWSPPHGADLSEIVTARTAPAGSAALPAFDSPAYLGANHLGVVRDLKLETNWIAHPPAELWRHKVGLGWSSFAVAGSQAITLEQRGENELIVCYELTTGHVLWTHTNQVRFHETMGGDGPRATPTIANGRVYSMGAAGILDCLALDTGKLLWSRDTLKDYHAPNLIWGKSCSPVLVDDLVVVTGGSSAAGPALLAYKCLDGAPAWHAGTGGASYPTPMLVTLAGRRQIVTVNAATVTGHDPGDGRVLWEYLWMHDQHPKCAQPLVLEGDRVFLSADYGYGCVMLHISTNAAGTLTASELWKGRSLKSQLSNMIARDGCIFGLDDGALTCIEAANGTRIWRDDRDSKQRYGHGQVLLVGDVLLLQNERGPIALVLADSSGLHELATLPALTSKTWNLPAIAGEYLLVRNDLEAVCYRLPLRGAK
jgi:outer membrane protein assembly factor BamB